MNNKKKGFTLIEMVVVIFIITLILLLTIPNIQKVIKIVQDEGCDSQVKIIDAAILEYMIVHDQAPTSIEQLISEGLLNEKQSRCKNGRNITITNGQAHAS